MTESPTIRPSVAALVRRSNAILLDYNGTLSDDEELLAELISEVSATELGIRLSRERYFLEFAGCTEEYMFEVLGKETGRLKKTPHELLQIFNGLYLERTRRHSTIAPATRDFVKGARRQGKRLVVVTAASRDVVVPVLEQADLLRELDGVVALEDVEAPKPHPEAYLTALERLRLAPSQAVAFEDSRTGITAARDAGITTVAVIGSLEEKALRELTEYTTHALAPELLG
ncbi:HAD family hydrolase [Rothia uropygialis]|uniref:HAD family hydrolase n=1 Tax=Kocuria sp. 36 TaxID=1415402 RepID=UPI00101D1AEC|nr:HAD family phosphatase [Kocuria sp. 36]